jgi:hypothetical protein
MVLAPRIITPSMTACPPYLNLSAMMAPPKTKRSGQTPAPFEFNPKSDLFSFLGFRRFLSFFGIALFESFNAARRVYHAFASGVKRMAGGAKLDFKRFTGGAGRENVTA